MKDDIIIAHLRDGQERKAFKALYAELPKVAALIKKNGGSAEEAKDIFQEGLIILHGKLNDPAFSLSAKVGTYLYAVCRNLWRDESRKRGKEITLAHEPEDDDINSLLETESRFRSAEKALRSLGDKCIDILKRFYLKKEDLQTIATALHFKGTGAAKTRKYKCLEEARKRFRRIHEQTVVTEILNP